MSTTPFTEPAPQRLLSLVHRHGPLTRAEIGRRLDLARSATGVAITGLEQLGLIQCGPPAESPRRLGRPSPQVSVQPRPRVLAAQVRPRSLTIAAVGLGRAITDRTEIALPPRARTPEAVADRIAELAAPLLRRHPGLTGLGIAVPAVLDAQRGQIHTAFHLGWRDVPFSPLLAERLPGLALFPCNDGHLAALAESRHGAAQEARVAVVLCGEEIGIGGGLIQHGVPFSGSAGHALAAGHLQLGSATPADCPCGATACFETQADARALLDRAGIPFATAADPRAALAAVLADPGAAAAVHTTAARLGEGLAVLVTLLNPDLVVLTGQLAAIHAAPGAHQQVRTAMETSHVARLNPVQLINGALPDPILLGAAELALAPLLSAPRTATTATG
ncbi:MULTISPECIES: ROK family protein [unclassified Crossiella]|uniref:ROK family transcriptional regulator n=1 Tax=unclassified Crossiella TaxID=2620835 RepID=UPI001FFE5A2B|nr:MULTISPECIES: ROK family protein [unclassified Crossiella]MCK2242252.1 ROK family protein [Crossiella sp. S99.2]MCK2254717.1 ROK family protein [Crossiella sp. S99.1]